MTNFGTTMAYNFGITILILIILTIFINYFYLKYKNGEIQLLKKQVEEGLSKLNKEKLAHFETGTELSSCAINLERLEKVFDESENEFDILAIKYVDLKEKHAKKMEDLNRVRASLRGYKTRGNK